MTKSTQERLCIVPPRQPTFILRSGLDHRAVLDTGAAPGAEIHFDAAGTLFDFDLEVAGTPLDAFKIRVSDQLDVQMPADLDQYGRDDSHRAVIGGKRLVQLGHDPANGR
jgi:hypothetical protein